MNQYEKIEAYLSKRMNDAAKRQFEAELAANAALREQVVNFSLLRTIASHKLLRRKIKSIHDAKVNEWYGVTYPDFEEKVTVVPTPQTEATTPYVAEDFIIGQEVDEAAEANTPPPIQPDDVPSGPPNRHLSAEVTPYVAEDFIIGQEVDEAAEANTPPPIQPDEETDDDEIAETDDEPYEWETETPKRRSYLRVLLPTVFLLLAAAVTFIYLAKTPVTIRPNPTVSEFSPDSLQRVYLADFEQGITELQQEDYLSAAADFTEVRQFGELPNYYNDAAHFLQTAAYAHQLPNRAQKNYDDITSRKTYNYPYTNKDKLQLWCKIHWAKLMGWNDSPSF